MKTSSRLPFPAKSALVRFLSPCLVVAAATLSASSAPIAPTEAKVEPKEYLLYMGTDISVEQNKAFHRVKDVNGRALVIEIDGQKVTVPMLNGQVSLKIEQSLKLAETAATIAKLTTERAYTPGNDPNRKFNANAGAAMGAAALNDLANTNMLTAQQNSDNMGRDLYAPQADKDNAAFAAQRAEQGSGDASYQMGHSDLNNTGFYALELQSELAEEMFDAMRVSFEVAAQKPLDKPYLVLIVRYHEKDGMPGMGSNWIYAKALDPIGTRPEKINILQGGLPKGFAVEECQVRLYNRGEEIATNVVPKRVPLTRNEAFEYLKIDHIGRHKGATVPASPAMGKLTQERKSQLTKEQLKLTYYVKVSKDGRAVAAFNDESCTQPVNEIIGSLVETIRFYPALANGKPVEGIAQLRVNQLDL